MELSSKLARRARFIFYINFALFVEWANARAGGAPPLCIGVIVLFSATCAELLTYARAARTSVDAERDSSDKKEIR